MDDHVMQRIKEAVAEQVSRHRLLEEHCEQEDVNACPQLARPRSPMTPVNIETMTPVEDEVNHPAHYTHGTIEVLDFLLDQDFPYLAGQVVKYLCRYRWKGRPVQDLQKARFYLDRLIRSEESK